METAKGKQKKFFADRAAATSTKRTRHDDIALGRLAAREVRKPRHYRLEFPVEDAPAGSGLAVSAREAAVTGRLAPVSFDLAAGEHLLVTGPNGAGKSTLLNWIAAGWPPVGEANGTITRADRVGHVLQRLPAEADFGFTPEIWARGIGELGRGILHPSLWTTPIADLSAGNQRRAQLALALATRPALLVVDEPTNYLDLETMQALEDALGAWPGALVVASHDRWLIDHWRGRRLQLAPASSSVE